MEHNQNTLLQLIINMTYGSNFVTIPDFFISQWQNWNCQGYFGSWEHALEAIIVERGLKKSQCMDSLPRQKKWPL